MKDQADTQTAERFPAPRRRGRPSTGSAKTNAQRQAEWRAKRKAELEALRNKKSRGDELPRVSDLVPELCQGQKVSGDLSALRALVGWYTAEYDGALHGSERPWMGAPINSVIRQTWVAAAEELKGVTENEEIKHLRRELEEEKSARMRYWARVNELIEENEGLRQELARVEQEKNEASALDAMQKHVIEELTVAVERLEKVKNRHVTKKDDISSVLIDCLDGAYADNLFNGGEPFATSRTFVARLCGALDSRPQYGAVRDRLLQVFPHLVAK